MTVTPQFAKSRIDAHVGLLMTDREKEFPKEERTRMAGKTNRPRPRRIMPVRDVGDFAKRIVREIEIKSCGPGWIQFLDHFCRMEKLAVEVRFVGQRPHDDRGVAVTIINHG